MEKHKITHIKDIDELKQFSDQKQAGNVARSADQNPSKKKKRNLYEKYVELETRLVSTEQIERSRFMVDFGLDLDKFYMNMAIQYGYLGMFLQVFPGAAVWAFIANAVIVIMTAKSYSMIARRSVSVEAESIGVWKEIFIAMSFISTVVNASIQAFPSSALSQFYGVESKFAGLGIVVLAEHILIIFKYLLTQLISDTPNSVEKRVKNEEYLRDQIVDKQIGKLSQKLEKKKLKQKKERLEAKLHAEVAAKFNSAAQLGRRQSGMDFDPSIFIGQNSVVKKIEDDLKRLLETKDTGVDENEQEDVLFNDDDYEISNKGDNISEPEDIDSGAEMYDDEDSEEAELNTETVFVQNEIQESHHGESKHLEQPRVKASRRKSSNFEPVVSQESQKEPTDTKTNQSIKNGLISKPKHKKSES